MKEIGKGQKIQLNKEINSDNFFLCFSWEAPSGYDIDLSIMLLSERGKLEKEDDFIFYNNPNTPNNSIKLHNSPFGIYKKVSEVTLNKISSNIARFMFLITIDNGDTNNQRFENVKNIKAHLLDQNKNVVLEYKIEGLTKETAIIAVEVYNHNGDWKYQATGNGFNAGLDKILAQYGSDAIQVQEPANSAPTPTNLPSTQTYSTPSNTATSAYSGNNFKIVLALDISFSMTMMLRDGTVQTFIEKLLDFSKRNNCLEIDLFPFHDEGFNHPNKINSTNINKFVSKEIVSKYFLGECHYEPVMQKIANKYSGAGKTSEPVLVVFLTDGDCNDKPKAEAKIKELSSKGIFWQFMAVGDKKSSFTFLANLDNMSGRVIDNADFSYIDSLKKLDHSEFQNHMMNEFPDWLKQAKNKGICN